ncbi:Kinesin-related protein 4, partial [Geodia barretti]
PGNVSAILQSPFQSLLVCLSLHIPYPDSKLTHILKQSLGGNARTAIICTVTPADLSETELTLKFATSVKRVRTDQ